MKKLDIAKTIQLIVFLILTLASIDLVLLDPELYHGYIVDPDYSWSCSL